RRPVRVPCAPVSPCGLPGLYCSEALRRPLHGEGPNARVVLPGHPAYQVTDHRRGEMSEWFKEHAWKACVGETLPWVRIPLSPPASAHDQVRRLSRRSRRAKADISLAPTDFPELRSAT